jgi:CRP/FNR family transcriptional regulator, anaerobic regulatory protein
MATQLRAKVERMTTIPLPDCDLYFSNSRVPLQLKAKDFFVQAGDVCTDMAFVEQGVLRMYYVTDNGKEINLQFFFENEFVVSYQSFILQNKSKYYIQALADCKLITISNESLQNAYKSSMAWQQFGRIIAEKVYVLTEQRTESLLFLTAEERYLKLLQKRPWIFEKVPLFHIASYLGIERESLSRLRKKLAQQPPIVT